jgi:hypothetical protein
MSLQQFHELREAVDRLARHVSTLQARIEVLESENRGRRTEDRKPAPAPRATQGIAKW